MVEDHQSEATKIISRSLHSHRRKRLFFTKIRSRFSSYQWYVVTYHQYKKGKMRSLSTITDKLRKLGFERFLGTRERTQDGYPHYHFLIGSKKEKGRPKATPPNIRNFKLYSRKFDFGIEYAYNIEGNPAYDPDQPHNKLLPITSRTTNLGARSIGFRQNWEYYGLIQYILYITKYLSFDSKEYIDYHIHRM